MPIDPVERLPDPFEVEGPAEQAGADALQFARHHAAHVGRRRCAALTQHFRLVRYDRRGHGKSGVPAGPYNMEMLGRDALAVLDAAEDRQDQLVRPLDGRHGRHVARRQRAAARRTG